MSEQKGSVLVYILIAVALFAALGFTVSRMMRSDNSIQTSKDAVFAAEVMNYANVLREAVQSIRISKGCEDHQISFERPPFDGADVEYLNKGAKYDSLCTVFHPNGGSVAFQDLFSDKRWRITSKLALKGLGSDEAEIAAVLEVTKDVCSIVNTQNGIDNAILATPLDLAGLDMDQLPPYAGQFEDSVVIDRKELTGYLSGCFTAPGKSAKLSYYVYQVLAMR